MYGPRKKAVGIFEDAEFTHGGRPGGTRLGMGGGSG